MFVASSKASNVLLICAHGPHADPRLQWIAAHCPASLRVHTLGVLPPESSEFTPTNSQKSGLIHALPRIAYQPNKLKQWYRLIDKDSAGISAIQKISRLHDLFGLSPHELAEAVGAPFGHKRLIVFRWYLKHFLDTCATLVTAANCWRGLNAIIATDLDTLLPGIILSRFHKVPLIYDAHELWSESDVANLECERSFWSQLEGSLLPLTNARFTVSPGLAAHQERLHGYSFGVLPNCEPIKRIPPTCPSDEPANGKCRFLFQGAFAEGRGLPELIRTWPLTDDRAVLLLRGRPNPFRDELIKEAKATGLYNKRIFFPAAVAEEELVHAAASSANVGLIPYPKTNTLYANCSPNKLSQYMAASLPILANSTNFVRDVVDEADCGMVIDFENTQALVEAVNTLLCDEALRRRYSQNGADHFRKTFNWQNMASGFYRDLAKFAARKPVFLTDSSPSIVPHYPEKPPPTLAVHITRSLQWILAEVSDTKSLIPKFLVLLRPFSRRIPPLLKIRLRQLFLRSS